MAATIALLYSPLAPPTPRGLPGQLACAKTHPLQRAVRGSKLAPGPLGDTIGGDGIQEFFLYLLTLELWRQIFLGLLADQLCEPGGGLDRLDPVAMVNQELASFGGETLQRVTNGVERIVFHCIVASSGFRELIIIEPARGFQPIRANKKWRIAGSLTRLAAESALPSELPAS